MTARAIALFAFLAAAETLACDCVQPKFDPTLKKAEAVFLGRVTFADEDRVVFDVGASWKGDQATLTLKLGQGTHCIYRFETGRDHLVFASRDGRDLSGRGREGWLSAGTCGYTVEAEDACELLTRLGPAATRRAPFPLLPTALAATATLLALAFGRTRRFAPAVAFAAAALVFSLWRTQRSGPTYLPPQSVAARPDADVPAGAETALPRRGKPWGPVVFGPGDEIYGAEEYGERICAFALDGGTRCVAGQGLSGALAVSADGGRLAVAQRRAVDIRALPSLEVVTTLKAESLRLVDDLAFLGGGRALVGDIGNEVAVVLVGEDGFRADTVLNRLAPPAQPGARIAFSGDGSRATLGWPELGPDGRWRPVVAVFDAAAGTQLAKFTRTCGGGRLNVSLDYAGNTLAWREADGMQVFDVGSQRLLQTLPAGAPHGRPTLSPDGKRVAMQFEAVELWDVATGKPLLRFQETGGMGPLSFAPDGKRIATLGESVIRVLETP